MRASSTRPRPPASAGSGCLAFAELQRLGRGSRVAPPMTRSGLQRRHDETDSPPPRATGTAAANIGRRTGLGAPPRRQPERMAPLGVSRTPRGPVPRGIATPPSSARRNALVFLDTTTVTPAGESPAAATATSKRRETSQPRKPRKRITHDIAPVHADTRGIKR